MNIPILWIALIAGIICALVGVIYWGETQKKGKRIRNIFMVLGVAGLVTAGLAWGNVIPQTYTYTEQPLAVQTPTNQVGSLCAVEDTTVTLSGQDNYLATATGGSHRYRVNGNIATVATDGATFTASPGDKIDVLWRNGTTTGYFSDVGSYTVPCKGTYEITEKLSRNGTFTTRLFNTNSVLIDGASNNQSITIGDLKSLKMEIEQPYQRDIPHGFVGVFEYNKSTLNNVIVQSNGVELPTADVPNSYAIGYSVSSARKAYLFPALESNKIQTYTVVLDAQSATAEAVLASNVNITYFPRNYFTNDKNGGAFEGPSVEDETNTLTRSANVDVAILYIQ